MKIVDRVTVQKIRFEGSNIFETERTSSEQVRQSLFLSRVLFTVFEELVS